MKRQRRQARGGAAAADTPPHSFTHAHSKSTHTHTHTLIRGKESQHRLAIYRALFGVVVKGGTQRGAPKARLCRKNDEEKR